VKEREKKFFPYRETVSISNGKILLFTGWSEQ